MISDYIIGGGTTGVFLSGGLIPLLPPDAMVGEEKFVRSSKGLEGCFPSQFLVHTFTVAEGRDVKGGTHGLKPLVTIESIVFQTNVIFLLSL
jgi:hypothetical protein